MKYLTVLFMASIMTITALADGNEADSYPLNFNPKILKITRSDRAISAVTFTSAGGEGTVSGWNTQTPFLVYADATEQTVSFRPGEEITVTCAANGFAWMYAYVYIDLNGNGLFDLDSGELVTQTTEGSTWASIPSFTLPDDLADGDYRVRFKTDWDCTDPAGRYGAKYSNNFINDNGGQIIDFTLRIDKNLKDARLREETEHCVLYALNGGALPENLRGMESLSFKVVPMEDYELDGTLDIVSEDGTTSIDIIPSDGVITTPICGNTLIRAHFKQSPAARWECIFNDEFNLDNQTWDEKKWVPEAKASSTWNRFNSSNPQDSVVLQHDGYLSLLTKTTGSNTMVTGNITTHNRCNFTYGRVEARCKVYPYSGNFPAFWMMPATQKPNYSGTGTWGGWPNSGEIDIMEQINTENRTYHTIHTYYANTLGKTYQKTHNESIDMNRKWHVYALEWDESQLRWYIDGRQVHTYDRIASKDNDQDRQWPYDRPFYVILNQSVGDGGWAASPTFSHQYRMDVDYLRIYQRCEPTAVLDMTAKSDDIKTSAVKGCIILSSQKETNVTVADLSGRIVFSGKINGRKVIPVPSGLYLVANKKVVVK